jgi:serine/threonine protein kinase
MATCPRCATFYVTATNCPRDGASLLDDESARSQGISPIAAERYCLQSMLGEGGMGTVYLATHRELGRNVAIKILRKDGQNSQSIERFKREAQASSLINHRNVVSILDFGELPDQSLFIVMEHLEGKSLADAIDNEGPFSVERTLGIAVQIAKGLAAAHEKKVIHRDLKPDNIFLLDNQDFPDFVKVLDFGIAKMLDGNRLTKTGMVLGTPDYMSPEQATGQPADHRADVYALGILMYEMLVGQRPFMGESFIQVLSQHLHAKPPYVAEQRTDIEIPIGLDDLIQICLAKQPDQRYQSMDAILQALYGLPGALSLLPEQLLPPNVGRRQSPPGIGLPPGGYASPKSGGAIPALTARTSPPIQPGVSRAVPGLASRPNQPITNRGTKPPSQDRVQTMITEEAPSPLPRPPSMMEDQPTNAWTDMATGIGELPETLPPELAKAAAKAAGAYETWHETAERNISTLMDGDFDKSQIPILDEATRAQPVRPVAYGNKPLQAKDPSKKIVIHAGKGEQGKSIPPAPSILARPNVSTLVDGQLNKNDFLTGDAATGDSTTVGQNITALPTSVVVNPLLLKDDTTPPPQIPAPQLSNRKGEVREAPVSVDFRSDEVMNEPTRIAPIAGRAPQAAPTAPTNINIHTETNDGQPIDENLDENDENPVDESSVSGEVTSDSNTRITAEQTAQKPFPQKSVVDLEGTDDPSLPGSDLEITMRPMRPNVRVKKDSLPPDPLEVQATLRPDQDKSTIERQKEKLEQIARIAMTARPQAIAEPEPEPKRGKLFAAIAVLAVALIGSGVYWFFLRG